MNPAFLRPRLIFKITQYIADRRRDLLKDLVAYSDDPVRYKRRLRMLIQLSQYEMDLLIKIRDFETDSVDDFGDAMLKHLQDEVDTVTNLDS